MAARKLWSLGGAAVLTAVIGVSVVASARVGERGSFSAHGSGGTGGLSSPANVAGHSDGSEVARRSLPFRARHAGDAAELSIVGVFVVDESGMLGDEAPLTFIRKLHDDGTQDRDWAGRSVQPGALLDDVLVKNPGPEAVRVYALVGPDMLEFDVPAGDGLMFGDLKALSAQLNSKHWCVCACDVFGPDDDVGGWHCAARHEEPCDCGAFDGANCVDSQGRKGTMKNCFYEMRFD